MGFIYQPAHLLVVWDYFSVHVYTVVRVFGFLLDCLRPPCLGHLFGLASVHRCGALKSSATLNSLLPAPDFFPTTPRALQLRHQHVLTMTLYNLVLHQAV